MNFDNLGKVTDASCMSRAPRKIAKATIQRGGRFGFSKTASEIMGLSIEKRLLIVVNSQELLYVKVVGSDDLRGFRLLKAGGYFSMPAIEFLQSLNIDYSSKDTTHIYDISSYEKDESDGKMIWKFALRRIPCNRCAGEKEVLPSSDPA